ncbi:MAG: hypothetical protein ACI39E_03480 [Acutalibacteraceae bacterium]
MKKVLGLVLTAAMLLTMLFAVSGLSVFAADNVNLIDKDLVKEGSAEGRAGSYEVLDNGGLKLTATGEKGYGVSMKLDKEFTVADLPYLQLDVQSTGRFNIALNVETKSGTGWPQLAADWFNIFQETQPAEGQGINATTYHGALSMDGYFTYDNNANMPADGKSTIISVSIALYEPGELTLNWLQLSSAEEFTVSGGTDVTTASGSDATTAPAATTAAAATTTAVSNAKTGEDTTLFVMMAAAMVVAGAVVLVTLRSKKSSAK